MKYIFFWSKLGIEEGADFGLEEKVNTQMLLYLWNLLLCLAKAFLEGNVLSQCSQGIDIPSKWLDSM